MLNSETQFWSTEYNSVYESLKRNSNHVGPFLPPNGSNCCRMTANTANLVFSLCLYDDSAIFFFFPWLDSTLFASSFVFFESYWSRISQFFSDFMSYPWSYMDSILLFLDMIFPIFKVLCFCTIVIVATRILIN